MSNLAVALLCFTVSFVASWGLTRWHARRRRPQPAPGPRDTATERAWGAAALVQERIHDASRDLIRHVDACGGACIIVFGSHENLCYLSNLPRAAGLHTLEACTEALRARHLEDEP